MQEFWTDNQNRPIGYQEYIHVFYDLVPLMFFFCFDFVLIFLIFPKCKYDRNRTVLNYLMTVPVLSEKSKLSPLDF